MPADVVRNDYVLPYLGHFTKDLGVKPWMNGAEASVRGYQLNKALRAKLNKMSDLQLMDDWDNWIARSTVGDKPGSWYGGNYGLWAINQSNDFAQKLRNAMLNGYSLAAPVGAAGIGYSLPSVEEMKRKYMK